MKKTIRHRAFLVAFLWIYGLALNAYAVPLNPEKLIYKASYMWIIPMGKAIVSTEPDSLDKNVYKIATHYESPKWLSIFFKVTSNVVSTVDSKTNLPIQYDETYLLTGYPQEHSVLIYDQKTGNLKIDENGRKEEKKIPLNTLDPLSAIYYLRAQTWTVGEKKSFNLNSHHNNYQLSLECVGQQKEALVLQGVLHRSDLLNLPPKAEFTVWMDLKMHIPLKIKLKTKVGYFTLSLLQS